MMSRFPHAGDALGATPGHPLLIPALAFAPELSLSRQQALLDLAAIQRIPGLAGYWPADPACLYEDSAGTIPANTNGIGVVGHARDISQGLVYKDNTLTGDNSTFTSGVGNWLGTRGGTISASGGLGILTPTTQTYSGMTRANSLIVGRYYEISFTHRLLSGTAQPLEARGMVADAGADGSMFTPTATRTVFTQRGVCLSTTFLITNGNVTPNGAVYEIDDVFVRELPGYHAYQTTTSNKPYLRCTPVSGIYWLDSNTAPSALTATLGNLGSACTVARSGAEGVTFTENVSIASTYNIAPAFGFNGDIAIFSRALTATEKALVTRYMQRSVPMLGPNTVVNGSFDADSNWTKATGWTIAAGVATYTGGTPGYLNQAGAMDYGKQYIVTLDVDIIAGSLSVYFEAAPALLIMTVTGAYRVCGVSAAYGSIGMAIRGNSSTPGQIASVDNIVVRPIL